MRALSAGFASLTILAMTRLASAQAQTQPWLEDRRFGGGIGIRAGDFELHPGIATEVGYDSNYFQAAGTVTGDGEVALIPAESRPVLPDGTAFGQNGTFNEPTLDTFRLRVTPSLTLQTLGAQRTEGSGEAAQPPKVNLQASLSGSYNELIATEAQYSDAVANRRFIEADAAVNADILPQRPWGVGLGAGYNRTVQPINDPTAPPGFQRSTFRGGAALKWRPGGGLLEWNLGYDLMYVMFEDNEFSNFSSVAHTMNLRGRWLFLPRTALIYTGHYGYLDYPDGGRIKPPGTPLSSLVGINGLLTNHFALQVMAGWKALFFEQDESYEGVVGNAELTWYPLPRPDLAPDAASVGLSAVSIGYRHDAQPSYIGNYFEVDGAYAKASYFFAGTVLTTLEAGIDHLRRPVSYFSDLTRQTSDFSENRATATLFGEYRTSDTFGVNLTLRYTGAFTDRVIPVTNDPSAQVLAYDDLSFSRFEAWAGVRWFL